MREVPRRYRLVMAAVAACGVLFLLGNQDYMLSHIKELNPKHLDSLESRKGHRHNEEMVHMNRNYPVCSRIGSLDEEISKEELNRVEFEEKHRLLMEKGELNCGNIRIGDGVITKRHNVPWKLECIPQILPAKRRLLRFIKDLCEAQEAAVQRHLHQDHVSVSSSSGNGSGFGSSGSFGSNSRNRNTQRGEKTSSFGTRAGPVSLDSERATGGEVLPAAGAAETGEAAAAEKRGVIFTGKYKHSREIFQAIFSLRMKDVKLPIEIWVNGRDMTLCEGVFNPNKMFSSLKISPEAATAPITCRALPNYVKGFASKFYALLSTSFTDAFFMDADNIAVEDITEIFNSPAYARTGSVLWPDLWGDRCRTDRSTNYPGESGFRTHVLWVSHFGGLKWSLQRQRAQEAEAGQMAINLKRHAGLLELGRKMIEDAAFFKIVVNGDKDLFRLTHLMMDDPFYYVPHIPAYSADIKGEKRDSLVHYFGGTPEETPHVIPSNTLTPSYTAATPASVDKTNSTTNTGTAATTNVAGSASKSSPSQATVNKYRGRGSNQQPADRPRPFFFHQLKTRDPDSFRHHLHVADGVRNAASVCVPWRFPPISPSSSAATSTLSKDSSDSTSSRDNMKVRDRGNKRVDSDDAEQPRNRSRSLISDNSYDYTRGRSSSNEVMITNASGDRSGSSDSRSRKRSSLDGRVTADKSSKRKRLRRLKTQSGNPEVRVKGDETAGNKTTTAAVSTASSLVVSASALTSAVARVATDTSKSSSSNIKRDTPNSDNTDDYNGAGIPELVFERNVPGTEEIKLFAARLFAAVDAAWERGGYQYLVDKQGLWLTVCFFLPAVPYC